MMTRLWTALITPFKENGELDIESLNNLIEEQKKAQNGVLILGSTGEGLNIEHSTKKQILQAALQIKGDAQYMVGLPGHQIDETLEWIDYCNTLNLDSYLAPVPLYAKPGPKGQTAWFKKVLDRSNKPVVLYNVPSRTGTSLSYETVKELVNHPNFKAIKEASGSTECFSQYEEITTTQMLFCGDDGLMPEFSKLGAYGLISVASNVWPYATDAYVNACINEDLTEEEISLWKNASNTLFLASNPVPAKILLHKNLKISSPLLRLPLSHEEEFNKEQLFEADKEINNWFKVKGN
ncbi:MAG: 4-hydroxy-tetrahydrodipicolinate synthase [Bacteriovoracaceae bacterium]